MEASMEAYTAVKTIIQTLEAKRVVWRVQEAAKQVPVDDLPPMFGGQSRPVGLHPIEAGKLILEDVEHAEKTLKGLLKKSVS
jgi:hypothetical protein